MDDSLPKLSRYGSRSFRKIVDAFLGGADLPFAEVLSEERIERIFEKHGCSFGLHGIYTPAIMVWSFLSQVLRDGKEASCKARAGKSDREAFQLEFFNGYRSVTHFLMSIFRF